MVERGTLNATVVGSNPTCASMYKEMRMLEVIWFVVMLLAVVAMIALFYNVRLMVKEIIAFRAEHPRKKGMITTRSYYDTYDPTRPPRRYK